MGRLYYGNGTDAIEMPDRTLTHLRVLATARRTAGHDPDSGDLRKAVTELLEQSDAWREADPHRRLTPTLRALARAQAGADHAALAEVARSLLAALARHPLSHLPAVAATASELRRVVTSGRRQLSPSGAGTVAAGPDGAPIGSRVYSRWSEIARLGTTKDKRKTGKMLFPLHRKATISSSVASKDLVRLEFRPLRTWRV